MNADFGIRSLSEDSASAILKHVHVESLSETISDFLETLDSCELSSEQLIEKKLVESEEALLGCDMILSNFQNMAIELDENFIPEFEHRKEQLALMFVNLNNMTERVLPTLEEDLDSIQKLVDVLDTRVTAYSREKAMGWFKMFSSSSKAGTCTVRQQEEHVRYANQISECKLHEASLLLQHLESEHSHLNTSVSCMEPDSMSVQNHEQFPSGATTSTGTGGTSSGTGKEPQPLTGQAAPEPVPVEDAGKCSIKNEAL
jgi:type I site-specific restriction endonuclease